MTPGTLPTRPQKEYASYPFVLPIASSIERDRRRFVAAELALLAVAFEGFVVAPAGSKRGQAKAKTKTIPTSELSSKELLLHHLGVQTDIPDDDNAFQTNNCADLEAGAFVLVAPWT